LSAATARGLVLATVLMTVAGPAFAHEGHATGPHPTATGAAGTAAGKDAAKSAPVPIVFRIRPEAQADLGWTGISHAQSWPAEQRLAFALDCRVGGGGRCAALGGTRGDFFGAPIPLSAGGFPACLVNRLRTGVGGSVDPKTGCGDLQIYLTSTVFTGEQLDRPCPICAADPTPNDGKREGHCEGGEAAGKPCDAQGVSPIFGDTSTDCAPSAGKNVGELAVDLAPLTTGEAALDASLTCKIRGSADAAHCFCPAQVESSACLGAGCGNDGRCPDGPLDGNCSKASYRGCRPGTGAADCDAIVPGSGECTDRIRPCFGERLTAAGHCDPKRPTYVAVFCAAQTRAAGLNASAGLPGPARVVLPLERVE
jgi:hypothetical protein